MRIRLALTLDIRREPEPEPLTRESTTDALVEAADSPIGFHADLNPGPKETP